MSYNKEKKVKHINKRLIIVIMLLIITIASSTFAWFTYVSRKSALVLTVGDINSARIILKPYQIKSSLEPVNVYKDGIYTEIEAINNGKDSILFTLFYKINDLRKELIENGLKYTVAQSESKNGEYKELYTGDFTGILKNEEIFSKIVAAQTTEYYRVYLWLDSSVGNQTLLQGIKLDLELNGHVEYIGEPPVLEEGMIPVTIANDGTVKTIDKNYGNWYNYPRKKWANAVLVSDESRSKYLNTNDLEISQNDILAYYVWIPRYKYKLNKVTCGSLSKINQEERPECFDLPYVVTTEQRELLVSKIREKESQGYYSCYGSDTTAGTGYNKCSETGLENKIKQLLNSSYVSSYTSDGRYVSGYHISSYIPSNQYSKTLVPEKLTQVIDVVFENSGTPKTLGNAVNTYYTHPAFWWDDDNDGITDSTEMLSGIWVGKFETTGTDSMPTILPNECSLTNLNLGNLFSIGKKFSESNNIYGLSNINSNSHMMKNSEWGAVAYLSKSQYGKVSEVRINTSWYTVSGDYYTDSITGCGGSSESASRYAGCDLKYGNIDNYPQSTTGNITGIFDMSGGVYEYVMGNYNNSIGQSGLSAMPDRKYYDLYTSSNLMTSCTLAECGGHALYETYTWNGDSGINLSETYPWYVRGGNYNGMTEAGIFAANSASGLGSLETNKRGFRSVIIHGFGQ